jgi:hypothetical protein
VGRFKGIMVKNVLPSRRSVMLAALLLPFALGGRGTALAGVRELEAAAGQVVADWRTGLALFGIDPVAYFAEGEAVLGVPELELDLGSAVWRFRNRGNRAAFVADPEVYVPRFAGYDPIAAGRGVATPGNPLVWSIHEQRLYLFHSPQARAEFAGDPAGAIAAGFKEWPALQARLDTTGSSDAAP